MCEVMGTQPPVIGEDHQGEIELGQFVHDEGEGPAEVDRALRRVLTVVLLN